MLMGHKLLPSEGDKSVLAQVGCGCLTRSCWESSPAHALTACGSSVGGCLLCGPAEGPASALPLQITDKNQQRLLRYLLRRPPSARWDAAKVASCLWFKTSDFQVRPAGMALCWCMGLCMANLLCHKLDMSCATRVAVLHEGLTCPPLLPSPACRRTASRAEHCTSEK